jgi:hypothetical protein
MRAPSVDNSFSPEYDGTVAIQSSMNNVTEESKDPSSLFFRGPYAFAATDFSGWACTSARCPNGDNPATRLGRNEIQALNCRADSGSFTITFRGNTTEAINFDDTHDVVEMRLEEVFTISHVKIQMLLADQVTAASANAVCSSNGATFAYIEFVTETGDVPALTVTSIDLTHSSSVVLAVSETVKGTKEDAECSGQGLCNEKTGQCMCTEGYGSSNGTVSGPGNRGDCTYRDIWMVT